MNDIHKKQFIDFKVSKLISAIRDQRKGSCRSLPASPCAEEKVQRYTKSPYTSNYEHRFQAQKEIINCQKNTICMQEQLIKQLQDEINCQKSEILMLKNSLSPNGYFKHKLGLEATGGGETTDKKNSSRSSTPSKLPDVLQSMKQREEERRRRWQLIKEQKALKEKQKEEAIAQEGLENKRKLFEIKKQRQREEIEKKKEAENRQKYEDRLKDNCIQFYKKLTLMIYFSKWSTVVQLSRNRLETAKNEINKHLLTIAIKNWKISTHTQIHLKQTAAENFYRCTVIKRFVVIWKNFCEEMKLMDENAIRVYEKELMASAFRRWHIFCLRSQIEKEEKLKLARNIYLRSLYKHYFQLWKDIPKMLYEKREQEKRLREWHNSVQQILPDFQIQE